MQTPSPPPAPRPRLLHWTARLVLLAACAGTVATSEATSPSVSSKAFVGDKVTLTNEAPRTTRDFIVRVSSATPHPNTVRADVESVIIARWIPAKPDEKARPWFKVSQFEGKEPSGQDTPRTFTADSDTLEVRQRTVPNTNCKLTQPCEWLTHLRLEMQADGPQGTLEVEWTSRASAAVARMNEVPAGFTVSISAP